MPTDHADAPLADSPLAELLRREVNWWIVKHEKGAAYSVPVNAGLVEKADAEHHLTPLGTQTLAALTVWREATAGEKERCPQDILMVRDLGDRIGYGHLMHLASAVWGAKLDADGHSGAQFAVGCCVAFMVPCQCHEMPPEDHCDWCCGTGRVTIRVAEAQKEAN